jgi:hypothetical protein
MIESSETCATDHIAGTLRKKPFLSFILRPRTKTVPTVNTRTIASQKMRNPAAGPSPGIYPILSLFASIVIITIIMKKKIERSISALRNFTPYR